MEIKAGEGEGEFWRFGHWAGIHHLQNANLLKVALYKYFSQRDRGHLEIPCSPLSDIT